MSAISAAANNENHRVSHRLRAFFCATRRARANGGIILFDRPRPGNNRIKKADSAMEKFGASGHHQALTGILACQVHGRRASAIIITPSNGTQRNLPSGYIIVRQPLFGVACLWASRVIIEHTGVQHFNGARIRWRVLTVLCAPMAGGHREIGSSNEIALIFL